MDKGFTLFDILFVLLSIVLCIIVFFHLTETENNNLKLSKYLTLTENAISKYNENGIGLAEYNENTKTTLQNTLEDIKLINPITRIKLFDKTTLILDIGSDCEKPLIVSRLVIYNDKIIKAEFTFCE